MRKKLLKGAIYQVIMVIYVLILLEKYDFISGKLFFKLYFVLT